MIFGTQNERQQGDQKQPEEHDCMVARWSEVGMMRLMRLSEDGYEIEETGLSHEECDALIAALSNATRSRAGARHLMKNPAVAEVAADPRLLARAQATLGAEAIPY